MEANTEFYQLTRCPLSLQTRENEYLFAVGGRRQRLR